MPVHHTLDAQLIRAGIMLTNARENAAILAALSEFGYDQAALEKGQALLELARRLSDAQKKERGDQYGATAELDRAQNAAETVYRKHRSVAATAFKNDSARMMAFTLNESRKLSFSGWLNQALRFYGNLLADPAALEALARYKLTREKLLEAQTLVKEVEHLKAVQEQEKGEALKATRDRDAALDELAEWLSEFRAIARVALADTPQLLEALEIKAS